MEAYFPRMSNNQERWFNYYDVSISIIVYVCRFVIDRVIALVVTLLWLQFDCSGCKFFVVII